MGSGGARARSGPAPDLASGRSDRLGRTVVDLPADGYKGRVPAFPIPPVHIDEEWVPSPKTGRMIAQWDKAASAAFRKAEVAVWRRIWRLPQAHAWAAEPWRVEGVGAYCRAAARWQEPGARAADGAHMLRLAEQIGLTPAGLALNGWRIKSDDVGAKRDELEQVAERRRGFKVVRGGAAAE